MRQTLPIARLTALPEYPHDVFPDQATAMNPTPFGPGIVILVGASGHALKDDGCFQHFPMQAAAILCTAVAVEDQARNEQTAAVNHPEGAISLQVHLPIGSQSQMFPLK